MFEFLKLKVKIDGNTLIIRKGIGRVKKAKEMTRDEYRRTINECLRNGVNPYAAAAGVRNLPEGVTELRTNIKLLRFFDNADRPAVALWYLAKYDRDTYYDLIERLAAIGCSR